MKTRNLLKKGLELLRLKWKNNEANWKLWKRIENLETFIWNLQIQFSLFYYKEMEEEKEAWIFLCQSKFKQILKNISIKTIYYTIKLK